MTSNVVVSGDMHNLVFAQSIHLTVPHSHSTASGFQGSGYGDGCEVGGRRLTSMNTVATD